MENLPTDFPTHAAWTLRGTRSGFEAVTIERAEQGWHFFGSTTALENDRAWQVSYLIAVDSAGVTRRADVSTRDGSRSRRTLLQHDGAGSWMVDGRPAPELVGCLDVDLESSALTNSFPVRRIIGAGSRRLESIPAAYLRIESAEVERLEQRYRRTEAGHGSSLICEYEAPIFDFSCEITYDSSGLVVTYPTIATRWEDD